MKGIGCISFCVMALTVLFASCEQKAFYEKNTSIREHKWDYDSIPSFEVHIDDASSTYDVYVNLRHNKNYRYSNIFFLLHEKGSGLKDTSYRHEAKLAELDGRWIGKSAGNLYHIQHWAKQGFVFPDTGVYTFRVEQNMRSNPLEGITDVGIKVVKTP